MPTQQLRIIVGGYLGLLPAGGVTWDYLQYPLGLARLGHDVYYIEDTRLWPVYQSQHDATSPPRADVTHLRDVMAAVGLDKRWAYRDEASGACLGLSAAKIEELCRTADLLMNVSCATVMRPEYLRIPRRVLIDSDPMFTQIQLATQTMFTAGEPRLAELVAQHSDHFTFGENIGADDCRIPACGIAWRPTRQPICLDEWPVTPVPTAPTAAVTTVMNWTAGRVLDYAGETWGQKDRELTRFWTLPSRVPGIPLELAVGQTTGAPFPADSARSEGWRIVRPQERVPDWRSYRAYLIGSRGEISIAKETYVKARTGWFSCRSACYLACGRPVVAQDTGWTKYLPRDAGLLAFDDLETAADALQRLVAEPERHSRAARRIAEEHFASDRVLGKLLADLGA